MCECRRPATKLNAKSCWYGCASVADRLYKAKNGESVGVPWMRTCSLEYILIAIPYVADRLSKKRRERWCAIDENLFYEFEPVLGEMTLRAKAPILFFSRVSAIVYVVNILVR